MILHSFLKVQQDYFRLIGFDLFANGPNTWERPYILTIANILLMLFMPGMMVYGIQNIKVMENVMHAMISVLTATLGMIKSATFVYYRLEINEFIGQLMRMLNKEGARSAQHVLIIAEANRRERFISSVYKNCFVIALLSGCLMPLVHMLGTFVMAGHVEPELPFPATYLWNTDDVANYVVTYIWNIIGALTAVIPTIAIDTLFCSITHNLCGLFQITQHKMLHFKACTDDRSRSNLEEALKLHKECLHMSQTLNYYFQPMIFAQLFIASLQLCVAGYQLSYQFTQIEIIYYGFLVLSMLGQLYIYCYCGEYIKTESENLAWAIYASQWYDALSLGIGRSLVVAMIQGQRGFRLKGYFFEPNMVTLSSVCQQQIIVRTAISYITLVRSIS